MLIRFEDYNGAEGQFIANYPVLWEELSQVLEAMPLHTKASDQAGFKESRSLIL